MISNTGQILRRNVFFFFFVRTILSNQPSRTDPKYLNANRKKKKRKVQEIHPYLNGNEKEESLFGADF